MKATQEVLSTERVALTKLIGRLQRQHQSALDQQDQQEQEIKQLKGQLVTEMTKGITAAPATPEVMYEVNSMAMDQVSVFPDGELHVKAFTPREKGRWSNVIANNYMGASRSPSVMSNRRVPGTPLSYSPKTPRRSSLRAPSPPLPPKPSLRETSPPLPPKPRAPSPPLSYNKYFKEAFL